METHGVSRRGLLGRFAALFGLSQLPAVPAGKVPQAEIEFWKATGPAWPATTEGLANQAGAAIVRHGKWRDVADKLRPGEVWIDDVYVRRAARSRYRFLYGEWADA